MAIFQFNMQVIGRSEGRSVVSAAAYRAAEKINNDYTGTIDDYTRKKWVEYSEVYLPPNAPPEYKDRAVLWNSVEHAEKGRTARLAREIEAALPIELSMEENIRLVQGFVQDTFVSDGMIADINIHNPPVTDSRGIPITKDGKPAADMEEMVFQNPHVHILLTVRPIDKNGKWAAKSQKEYVCKKGNIVRNMTAEEFRTAKSQGWEKEYQYWEGKEKVWLTPSEAFSRNLVRISKNPRSTPYGRRDAQMERWNSTEALLEYRSAWEGHVNRALEQAGRPERVDCRSYQEQGKDTVSGIHLGSYSSKKKESSGRYRINEEIHSINETNKSIRKKIEDIERKLADRKGRFYDSLAEQLGALESDIVSLRCSLDSLEQQTAALAQDIRKQKDSITRIQTVQENIRSKNQASRQKIGQWTEQLESLPDKGIQRHKLQQAIQEEQENIRFRNQRFLKILEEEGFSSVIDFQQECQILRQMEQEYRKLEKKTASIEGNIRDYTKRYENLCQYLPKEDSGYADRFWKKHRESLHKKQAENRNLHPVRLDHSSFSRILHQTDYALNHTFYLARRTGYLLQKLEDVQEQQMGEKRSR